MDAELDGAETGDGDERVEDHRLLLRVHREEAGEHDLHVSSPARTDGVSARQPLLEDVVVQETAG